ncbi:hypothetical protein Tco_0697330 [Tanacetum coccineum]
MPELRLPQGLESVEARLLVYKKNESVYKEDIKVLKREIHLREVVITELRRKLELAQKQKDEIQLTVENFKNSSNNLSKLIDCQIVNKCKTVKKPVVETSEAKASADKPKVVRKNFGPLIIKDWVSDSEEDDVTQAKIEKKTVKPSFAKIELKAVVNAARPKVVVNAVKGNNVNTVKASACWIQVSDGLDSRKKLFFLSNVQGNPQMDLQDQGVIDSRCSRHMTGNMSYLTDYEEIDGGYVAFGDPPEGCLDCFWSIEVSVSQQPCIFSWNPSSLYVDNNGYCKAIYDGCNSEILLGPPTLLSTTISLEGTPSPKSLVIRATTSDTVGVLYCRADVWSLRRRSSKLTDSCE